MELGLTSGQIYGLMDEKMLPWRYVGNQRVIPRADWEKRRNLLVPTKR